LAVKQAATFYGTMTVMGEAGFESKVTFKNEVEFQDHITVDVDTAGTIKLAAGETSVKIVFAKPYSLMPRVVANLQSSGTPVFMPYLIADKSTTSFSIILQNPAPSDLYFDWIALAAKDPVGQVAGAVETSVMPENSVPIPAAEIIASSTEPIIIKSSTEPIISESNSEPALPIIEVATST
jgi:hypothetical protein